MMDKATKKKHMIIAIVIVFSIAIVALAVLLIDNSAAGTPNDTQSDETTLRPLLAIPNWGENIFEDEEWLDKNRYLTVIDGGMSVTVTDESYSDYGICTEFMALYFEALVNGNAEALCGFYADEYFTDNYRWDEITMQKLYDMKMELISTTSTASEIVYVYKISYKIMDNDGTFRNDVKSDAERPEFYTIVEDTYDIKITDVSYTYGPQ